MADIGVEPRRRRSLRSERKGKGTADKRAGGCRQLLMDTIKEQMHADENAYDFEKKTSLSS